MSGEYTPHDILRGYGDPQLELQRAAVRLEEAKKQFDKAMKGVQDELENFNKTFTEMAKELKP